jgi:serine/threonine protein kinase/tetratricopeptide (TPR) repeat protein
MSDQRTKTLRMESAQLPAGKIISGKFRILGELGRGGMGIVYEAEDIRLKRTVALKFLPSELTGDPEARERFIQEAQAASGLDHANICTIHEIGETEAGEMFIAMASYKGKSLKEKIQTGPIEPAEVISFATQIAEGLAKAHEQGIVHRDVKPGNIFVTAEGTVKILDFGLAKLAGQVRLTLPGTTMGTVAYMSPEQAAGESVDARSDVWSLGVVLYEMLTGELPFWADKEQAVLYSILHKPPRPVKEIRPGFPAEVESIIRRALAKDPVKRFASAGEMAAALRNLKDKMTARAYPTARRLSFTRPRRKILFLSAASTLSLVAVILVIWFLNRPSLAFETRDKLMVADVDNLTGDKVFDLALRTAIEADLQQSPYASIFDKPQIAETLRLMRLDPASKVDEMVGYEVCRFAGVRAFILPRILSVGEAYELQAILIDPVKRRHVDRFRVTARGKEEVLLKGIDKLAGELRSRLGESMNSIQKADRSVAQVTTSSWDALNYFSMGMAKWQSGNYREAATLLELALEKDPQFVDARSSLGLVEIQFLNQAEKGKDLLSQALKYAVSQNLPQRDILKLKAANKQFVEGDLTGALEEYRTMQDLFPDFMPPWNNSGRILLSLKRYDEAAAMYERAAQVAPRNSIPLQNLWFLYMFNIKNAVASEQVARRMVSLAPGLAYPSSYLGFSLAAQGRFEEAEEEFRKTIEIEPDHPYAVANLAHVLFAQGKAGDAVPFYRKVIDLTQQGKTGGSVEGDTLALIHALKNSGDIEAAKKLASELGVSVHKRTASTGLKLGDLFILGEIEAIIGRPSEANRYLRQILAKKAKDADTLMGIAEFYALLGQNEAAISTLKKSLNAGYRDYFFPVILPAFQSIRRHPEFRALFKLTK